MAKRHMRGRPDHAAPDGKVNTPMLHVCNGAVAEGTRRGAVAIRQTESHAANAIASAGASAEGRRMQASNDQFWNSSKEYC